MEIPRLRDYFILSSQVESISNEMHYIPGASPYAIDLHQLPKIRTGATSVAGNVWLSIADATTLVTVQVETSPSTWQTCALTTTSPGALEAQFQIADTATFPYSPRIIFQSAYAGLQARVTYTGMGSMPIARYLQWLYDFASRQQLSGPIHLVDQATYNSGWYDGRGTADKTIELTPSSLLYSNAALSVLTFSGLTIDFGASGNAEVAAFTNASYWKRILLELSHNGSTWTVSTSESAEASLQSGLATPSTFDYTKLIVGYVDVENTGTPAVAGEVEAVESGNIQQWAFTERPQFYEQTVRVKGPLVAGELDVPFCPHRGGKVYGAGIYVDEAGSASETKVDIHKCNSGSPAGTTIFSSGGAQPTVTNDTGNPGKDYASGADFDSTGQLFTASDWFRFYADTIGTGSDGLSITMYYHTDRT